MKTDWEMVGLLRIGPAEFIVHISIIQRLVICKA